MVLRGFTRKLGPGAEPRADRKRSYILGITVPRVSSMNGAETFWAYQQRKERKISIVREKRLYSEALFLKPERKPGPTKPKGRNPPRSSLATRPWPFGTWTESLRPSRGPLKTQSYPAAMLDKEPKQPRWERAGTRRPKTMLMTLAIKKWLSNQRARLPLRKDSPLRVL